MQDLLGSQTHLDGVFEKRIMMWKSEFLHGWWIMATESLPLIRKQDRVKPGLRVLRVQKEQLCPVLVKLAPSEEQHQKCISISLCS
jgi:hypothetical protein